jgi:hypothetical protein
MTNMERLAVLLEEVGEVVRALLEQRLAHDKHGKDAKRPVR